MRYILKLSCPDKVGVVAAVSVFLTEHQASIVESSQHSDESVNVFFMRVEIDAKSCEATLSQIKDAFKTVADEYEMNWSINSTAQKKQVVLLVSQYEHCLADLLYRWRTQDIEFDIPCVISNHETLKELVTWHKIPFFHVPINKANKEEAFEEIIRLYRQHNGDTMVLARFMQILPPSLCEALSEKIINIHHSFLPSFVGAKPYHQAFEHGVKLIGATCHYVTAELDAGPIIEQEVQRVDHSYSIDDMVRLGRDVEKAALARGVKYHVEDRVIVYDNKTVVFS